jgi:hypothetical protein
MNMNDQPNNSRQGAKKLARGDQKLLVMMLPMSDFTIKQITSDQ